VVIELKIGQILKLKKPHPCGGYEWVVKRLGADIGIECLKCGRYVMIPRHELERRIKEIMCDRRDII